MEATLNEAERPIIAILTVDDAEHHFRGNRSNFIDIIKTGTEMGYIVYIVTAKDLQLTMNRVIGFTYDVDSKTWKKQWFPLPHIVYNRIPAREDELTPYVQQTIENCLKHPKIKLFNPEFFNKWTLFEWLRKSKSTRKFIPATRKLTSQVELSRLLKQFPFLYLKPEKGKAGMGIMRLKYVPLKALPFRLSIQDKKKSLTYKCSNISKLWDKIGSLTGEEEYIVQQGIELSNVDQRPFDLRVLVQKNSKGQWDLTGIGARVAGEDSITTHVPRGGTIDDPERLLTSTFGPDMAQKIITRAKNAALIIARQIEKGSGHPHGEMSMDLGIDTRGSLWFFEANAKPMKFDEPHIRKKSLERIFQYSQFLGRNIMNKSYRINKGG